jgi:extracellular factor (EF) 3-hydroxypalmitic acid methyl ester biosynthesis protein
VENNEAAPAADIALSGELEQPDGRRIPVTLSFASRISLYVAFSGPPPADLSEFKRLMVRLEDRQAELSACRFQVEYTRMGYSGRVVFLEDVYDCKALVYDKKFVNLKAFFQNVPLVLAQKERVRPEFREFVSNLTYDLAVYKKFFNEQDRILANEPVAVATAAQQSLMRTEGREFMRYFDGTVARLGELVSGFDKEEHERHGFYLRKQAWEVILASEFLKRTNLKPRGYAGDAEMMQMCYENQYLGNYVFNKLLHKHPVESAAAQAVRNRRRLIPKVLRACLDKFPHLPARGFRFLSVASGPAWELQDLFLDADDFERFHCALLDQDPHALACARSMVQKIESSRDIRIQVEFFSDSVRTFLRTTNMAERMGRYHFIYSMGLFDYLTPPVARAVLAKIFDLLLPGGTMVIGNYHVGNPTRFYMEYWMDWVLYYRTEEDFLDLASALPAAKRSVSFDETRSQMFLHLEKAA